MMPEHPKHGTPEDSGSRPVFRTHIQPTTTTQSSTTSVRRARFEGNGFQRTPSPTNPPQLTPYPIHDGHDLHRPRRSFRHAQPLPRHSYSRFLAVRGWVLAMSYLAAGSGDAMDPVDVTCVGSTMGPLTTPQAARAPCAPLAQWPVATSLPPANPWVRRLERLHDFLANPCAPAIPWAEAIPWDAASGGRIVRFRLPVASASATVRARVPRGCGILGAVPTVLHPDVSPSPGALRWLQRVA